MLPFGANVPNEQSYEYFLSARKCKRRQAHPVAAADRRDRFRLRGNGNIEERLSLERERGGMGGGGGTNKIRR